MLSCSLANLLILNISYSLNIDSSHSFTISLMGNNAINIGNNVSIYRDGKTVMIGVITGIQKNSAGITAITGQDISSYYFENTNLQDVFCDELQLTDLSKASAKIDPLISCPALPCYGFGSYSGSVSSYIERICNSFGLHYLYNPTEKSVLISEAVVEPSNEITTVPTLSYNSQQSEANSISTIYLQKSVNIPEYEEVDIKNGSKTWQISSPITNSITGDGSAYPNNVYIDPGTWQQVILYSNSTFVEYSERVELSGFKKVSIESWSDTSADPRWELYLYDGDNLLKHWYRTGEIHAWESNGSEVATSAVICRIDPNTNGIDYPDSDGILCTVKAWQEIPSNITPWEQSFDSGDNGHPDTNVIDDPMFPPVNQLDGVRIAKRDSNPFTNEITAPNIQNIDINLPVKTFANLSNDSGGFSSIKIPLVSISQSIEGNNETTRITGEY